jgi:hypothetical protein
MKLKWILAGLIISMLIHLSLMLGLGKININLPSFDFISTYLFEEEKNKTVSTKTPLLPVGRQETISKTTKSEKQIKDNTEQTSPQSDIKTTETQTQEENKIFQSDGDNALSNAKNTATQIQNNPFTRFLNERMKFDIYWMGIYAGSATIKVKGDSNEISITSQVNSASFISNFYYVNDRAESIIVNGRPKHFHLVQIEGKHQGNKEVFFDYDAGEITFINHLKNKTTFHKGINKIFMDALSGFFYLRSLPVNLNQSIFIDIFDSDKFATVEVQPIKEETIETANNKQINTLVIKPVLTTEGLFKRKGDIFIWISNDDKKIPLKIETKVSFGKVVAELKEYKKD